LLKSFGQAFSKACGVKGLRPFSPSADGETSPSAFLFDSFFFAPPSCKEKAAKEFVQFDTLDTFVYKRRGCLKSTI